MSIAETILEQLGKQLLIMIGAKNPVGFANGVSMQIGKNSKGVKWMRITLRNDDLYDVEYFDNKAGSIAKDTYVSAELLYRSIEANTGMFAVLV